jgi:hypothetical protein
VQAKVEQFAQATASHDYDTICQQVLAPLLLTRLTASGITCPQAMQIALGALQHPTLSIGRITVHGASASVITLSTARGQRASISTLKLVQTHSGWRISALASPTG